MKERIRILLWVLPVTALFMAACREAAERDGPVAEDERLVVYVVNYPLQYFAERIGAQQVEVYFPAPRDVDPAEWSPDDETILRYQQADLILLNGAGYARWAAHASLPPARTVNTARNTEDRLLEVPDAIVHSHGPGDAHTHAGTAFTTWLDPLLAIEHARVVKDAFSQRLPAYADEFANRFEALASDLQNLDRELNEVVSQNPQQPLLASHPVYHYLEDRYALRLESLHWEPDEMPSPSEWAALDEKLEDHPAEWILWEDEPLAESLALLEDRGVRSVVYNPSSQPPDSGDFLDVMHQNVENLREAFHSSGMPR